MANFQRLPGKFAYSGMDIHHPPDLLPPDKCSLMFNLQPDIQSGALALRPPISTLMTTAAGVPVHSIVRLNDSVPSAAVAFLRFLGAGASLYAGNTSSAAFSDSGFSGNPLAMVPYRPAQSPEPWLYVFDSLKQQRYKTDFTKQNIGIAAPTAEPAAARIQPLYKLFTNTQSNATWSSPFSMALNGTVSAPGVIARIPAATTAPIVLYDSGSTGMACISVSTGGSGAGSFWMTPGSGVIIDSEQIYIEEVFNYWGPPSPTSITVGSIAYDTGSTGLCTIVPSVFVPGLRRNQLLIINSIPVRVLNVTAGPDGTYSFRCDSGGSTFANGNTITSPAHFRAWTASNHVATAPLSSNNITATFTPTGAGNTIMSGVVFGPPASAVDITQISGRPMSNEDYVHVGLMFDHPERITEVHIMIDVAAVGSPTFQNNYLYYVLRQSDFQQSALGGANSGQVNTIQSQLSAIEYGVAAQLAPDVIPAMAQPLYPTPENPSTSSPTPQSFATGQSAWVDAFFKIGDMTRVGTDSSLGFQYIFNGFGLLVYTNVITPGNAVSVNIADCYVSGGYGPDCNFNANGNQAPPIQWRYRYRNSLTGAHSTVSPELRSGEILRRQGINLTCPNSPDAQVDTVDWERRGGTNPDWHYVGSVPQGTTFLDDVTESAAQAGDPLEVKCYQPWPVTDIPHTGVATVVGTSVVRSSGDLFNVRWLRGTEFIIGGNTYSLYAPPTSTGVLQLAQNVPVAGSYAFQIPEATIEGQPLYGCWLDESNNRICGVGDPLNPGWMYFGNNDNPDGAADDGYIEITSPSGPLLNGFYAEGANWVFTSSSLYRVDSVSGAVNQYVAYRVSGVEGLAGAWAFDAQRRMVFWWGPDGIYVYQYGAAAENLTASDLYPLFPHAGQLGQPGIPGLPISIADQTIYPPDYIQAQLLRVGYSESFVYATYLNSNGSTEALVYSLGAKGWHKNAYLPAAALFVLEKGIANPALMVGGADGNLYKVEPTGSHTADPGGAISWVVLPPCKDAGDSRAQKQWGDLLLDYSLVNGTSLQVLWDNLLVTGPLIGVAPTVQRAHAVLDLVAPPNLNDTPALLHYNMTGLLIGSGPVYLYEWQPSFLPLPEDTTARVGDWQIGSSKGFKWINGVIIHADTYGLPKRVQVEYDNQQVGVTITINHNGEQRLPYYFPPVYAHELRIVPLDDAVWHDWQDEEWIGNNEPESGAAVNVNWVNGGVSQFKWVNGFKLHFDTFGQNKKLRIHHDNGTFDIVVNSATVESLGPGPTERILPYYWTPVYTHQMRIEPLDTVPWRWWPDTEWLFNNEPEYGGALAVNWLSPGGTGQFKWINGLKLHADTFNVVKQLQIQYDGGQIGPTITPRHNGEETLPYYFPPIYAHMVRIVPLDPNIWRWWPDTEWIFNLEPEYGGQMAVNWLNGGTPHYKWVQGIRLHADTFGQSKTIQIQYEGGIAGPTLTINHNGEEVLPYSWIPPFKAHLMRIVPLDNVPWRYWADTEWVYTLEPEIANFWVSQPTSFDLPGFLHMRELWPAYAGASGGVVALSIDGATAVPIATLAPASVPSKPYFPCPPVKGKLWQLIVSGTGLQLYERDTEFLIKPWGDTGPYKRIRPFGDSSGGGQSSGARI